MPKRPVFKRSQNASFLDGAGLKFPLTRAQNSRMRCPLRGPLQTMLIAASAFFLGNFYGASRCGTPLCEERAPTLAPVLRVRLCLPPFSRIFSERVDPWMRRESGATVSALKSKTEILRACEFYPCNGFSVLHESRRVRPSLQECLQEPQSINLYKPL